jgi:clan AA aspartic protease
MSTPSPSPGTPGEGWGGGDLERTKSLDTPKRVHRGYESRFTFEITLTPTPPTLSRNTGRGGSDSDGLAPSFSAKLSVALHRGYAPPTAAPHLKVAVSNPGNPQRRWEGLFLVDAGAIDCMAQATHLRAIGNEPRGKRTYELADGTEIIMDIGVASVEFMGEVVGVTIIFGQDDVEPILGVTALESVGIEVDPQNQRLKRLPAVRLK